MLQDLPPIEDLHITIDESVQFKEIGKIVSVVEVLGEKPSQFRFFCPSYYCYCYCCHHVLRMDPNSGLKAAGLRNGQC